MDLLEVFCDVFVEAPWLYLFSGGFLVRAVPRGDHERAVPNHRRRQRSDPGADPRHPAHGQSKSIIDQRDGTPLNNIEFSVRL